MVKNKRANVKKRNWSLGEKYKIEPFFIKMKHSLVLNWPSNIIGYYIKESLCKTSQNCHGNSFSVQIHILNSKWTTVKERIVP